MQECIRENGQKCKKRDREEKRNFTQTENNGVKKLEGNTEAVISEVEQVFCALTLDWCRPSFSYSESLLSMPSSKSSRP